MLIEIKKMLEARKILSLYELSVHFDVDPSAMDQVVQLLIDKGEVKKKDLNCGSKGCGGCSSGSCDPSKMVFYERISSDADNL